MPRLTLRAASAGAAAAALLALAACSSDDQDGDADATANTESAAFPVTIDNKLGSVEVESRPERVVALGQAELDNSLALGVTPVAYGGFGVPLFEYQSDAIEAGQEPVEIDLSAGVPIEEVLSQSPDLVVDLSWSTPANYKQLTSVVPVVSYVTAAWGDDWRTQVGQIAPALGKSDEAEAMIAGIEDKIADAAESSPDLAGKVVTYATPSQEGGVCVVDLPTAPALDLLTGFGLTPNPEFSDPKSLYCREVSLENIKEIDSDLVVMVGTAQDRARLEKSGLYSKLDVVQNDRVVWVDGDGPVASALNAPTLLSIPMVVDEMVPQLVAAVT